MAGEKKNGYVTHLEFQTGFKHLSDLILRQGEETAKNAETTAAALTALRQEMRSDISHGKLDGRALIGLATLLIMMVGMGAALVAFSLRSAVAPHTSDISHLNSSVKLITARMDADHSRENKDAFNHGSASARLSAIESRLNRELSSAIKISK